MDQSKMPDAVIKRLVDYASTLTSPKNLALMDDAVSVIGYVIRQVGQREEVIKSLRADVTARSLEISELRLFQENLLSKEKKIIDILRPPA